MGSELKDKDMNIQDVFARIRYVLGAKNTREAMDKMSIPRGTYNSWLFYKKISSAKLSDFCLKHGLKRDWLVHGIGSMYPEGHTTQVVSA